MPNWCYTNFVFHGERSDLERLDDIILNSYKKCPIDTDFGSGWLGAIVYASFIEKGLSDLEALNALDSSCRCRGNVVESYWEDDTHKALHVDTETAWVYMAEMWDLVIEAFDLPSIYFTFSAEEPGASLYVTYDPHSEDFFDKYYVDISLKRDGKLIDSFIEYYIDDRMVRDLIEEIMPQYRNMNMPMGKLIDMANSEEGVSNYDEDSYVSIIEIEFIKDYEF